MKQDALFDERIKAALKLQTPKILDSSFAGRLRMEAERTAITPLFKGGALSFQFSPVYALAASLLFVAGLSMGTLYSPFNFKTTQAGGLYSFYNVGSGGYL